MSGLFDKGPHRRRRGPRVSLNMTERRARTAVLWLEAMLQASQGNSGVSEEREMLKLVRDLRAGIELCAITRRRMKG